MKTTLNIKNFRVFDENGVTFELNPVSILTGSNSSGKSSVVKAIFLLNSFLAQIKKAIENGDPIELANFKLDFTTYPNNLLGRFDKVVHDGSESNTITIEYTMHSLMLSKDVTVQLVFSADENDELNNAFLDSIKMSTNDGIFYYSGKGAYSYCNLNIIKEYFITFLLAECAVHSYCGVESKYEIEGGISEEEHDKTVKEIVDYLRDFEKSRRNDIFRFVRSSKRKKSLIHEMGTNPSVIEDLQEKESIFSIPVVDKLATMSKNEVECYITSELLNGKAEDLILASSKIINDFLQSDFDNFADYFANFEKQAFEQRFCSSKGFLSRNKNVRLMKSNELALAQDYLTFNPFNMKDSITFNGDFEPIEEDENEKQAKRKKAIEEWKNYTLTFDMLYEVVMAWNKVIAPDGNGVYVYNEPSALDPWGSYYHIAFKLFTKFVEVLVQEVVCPDWCGNMSYVSSARAGVSRLYTLDKKDDFSMLLQNYFEKKRLYLDYAKNNHNIGKRDYVVDSFMNRWIEKFEIGKSISLRVDKDGLGVQIRLHKADGDEGRILADEGYGITQLVSILLQIETAILAAKGEKVNNYYGLNNLDGYDDRKFHYEINTIAIEEPEIHLHPKYQSLLADMFLEAYVKYNIHFIIETHSEYLIRKAQVFVARSKYENEETMKQENPFKVYYVPRGEEPYEMTFCADGRFKNEFGKGFFDEAANLAFEIL